MAQITVDQVARVAVSFPHICRGTRSGAVGATLRSQSPRPSGMRKLRTPLLEVGGPRRCCASFSDRTATVQRRLDAWGRLVWRE